MVGVKTSQQQLGFQTKCISFDGNWKQYDKKFKVSSTGYSLIVNAVALRCYVLGGWSVL